MTANRSTRPAPPHRRSLPATALALAALLTSCSGSGGGTESGPGTDPRTAGPLTLTTRTPSPDKQAVALDAVLTVRFSTPVATVPAGAVGVVGVDGTVTTSGREVRFQPDSPLAYGTTYEAWVSTAVTGQNGAAMNTEYRWRFTTISEPQPGIAIPLIPGATWVYDVESTSSSFWWRGSSTRTFRGTRYARVVSDQVILGGHPATHLRMYDLEEEPDEDPFRVLDRYVRNDPSGLYCWDRSSSNTPRWLQVLDYRSASVRYDNTFWMIRPRESAWTRLSSSTTTVPFGTMPTLRARHEFRTQGSYYSHYITESNTEHYADRIGLVETSWRYSSNDQDPQGTDFSSRGTIKLAGIPAVDNTPFPEIVAEVEPNERSGALAAVQPFSIIEADTHADDDASWWNHPLLAQRIKPDSNGVRKLHDLYRIEIGSTAQRLRVDLKIHGETGDDLNLYLLGTHPSLGSALMALDASTNTATRSEALEITGRQPGVYYLAVQAWSSASARVNYSMAFRDLTP